MSSKIKTWPDQYALWTGDFSELIKTANEIVEGLGYDPDITERSVRNYQHRAVVGRGQRQGKSSVFSFADLAELVATKTLIKEGWNLSQTALYFSSESAPATFPQSFQATTETLSSAAMSPASRVVSDLMNNSLGGQLGAYQAKSLSNSFATRSMASTSPSLPPVTNQPLNHVLAPGVHLNIDTTAWNSLSPQKKKEFLDFVSLSSSSLQSIIQGK